MFLREFDHFLSVWYGLSGIWLNSPFVRQICITNLLQLITEFGSSLDLSTVIFVFRTLSATFLIMSSALVNTPMMMLVTEVKCIILLKIWFEGKQPVINNQATLWPQWYPFWNFVMTVTVSKVGQNCGQLEKAERKFWPFYGCENLKKETSATSSKQFSRHLSGETIYFYSYVIF